MVKKKVVLKNRVKVTKIVKVDTTSKINEGPWTQFWDMHSGGGLKEKWSQIFIQAPEEEARVIFYNRFGHNADRVTCTCCGNDYSVSEFDTLSDATGYHRGCKSNDHAKKGEPLYLDVPEDGKFESYRAKNFMTFEEFLQVRRYKESGERGEVLLITRDDIKPEWRSGCVPEQGYVWQN